MTPMIPEEAVQAAAKAVYLVRVNNIVVPQSKSEYQTVAERDARTALEAAAPHMAAQALRDAVEAFPLETITAPDNAVAWLMHRAEQLGT